MTGISARRAFRRRLNKRRLCKARAIGPGLMLVEAKNYIYMIITSQFNEKP
jgi:hypothetical protein